MESIWKTVLTFAVIILITVLGITITAVNVDVTAAGGYLEEVSVVIRESNYNEEVIDQCVAEASSNGYILEVEVYESLEYAKSRYARVRLSYPYRLPVLNISDRKIKEKII